ncbi:Xaa-Pro peptidase family protein [Eubacteriaceae bacterium ES2]|nr:Xaa-Pro peptidase family protein [Eubacteriaceae bacterium ES2]
MALSKAFHQSRRLALGENLKEHDLALVFSGQEVMMSADANYPFRVNHNFYYLTGLEEASVMCVLYKNEHGELEETLYLNEVDPLKEKWEGRKLRSDEAVHLTGIHCVRTFNALADDLKAKKISTLFLDSRMMPYQNFKITDEALKQFLKKQTTADLNPFFEKMRLIKTTEEVAAIKKASQMTKKAFKRVRQEIKAGLYEYELAACFEYLIRRWGAQGTAFESIVASGENATTLHYISNQKRIREGELVLFDIGARVNGYCGDLSRTVSVSNDMTDEQAMYHEMVKSVQQEMFKSFKPGVSLKELQQKTMKLFEESCRSNHCMPASDDITEYYFHGIGHSLGLDTHDIRPQGDLVLEPGMVMTVEPGIYVKEAGIGIRIEDDVVITPSGCEVL